MYTDPDALPTDGSVIVAILQADYGFAQAGNVGEIPQSHFKNAIVVYEGGWFADTDNRHGWLFKLEDYNSLISVNQIVGLPTGWVASGANAIRIDEEVAEG